MEILIVERQINELYNGKEVYLLPGKFWIKLGDKDSLEPITMFIGFIEISKISLDLLDHGTGIEIEGLTINKK